MTEESILKSLNTHPWGSQISRTMVDMFNFLNDRVDLVGESDAGGSRIYVNGNTGDDLTGVRGIPAAQFKTIAAAQAVALPGDIILIGNALYTDENNLGKNQVTYYFANGAVVEVTPGQTLWTDVAQGYEVRGFGEFRTPVGSSSSTLINLFYGTSKTVFEFKSINADCTYAVVNCTNSGYGRTFRGESMNNTYTGTTGRTMRFSGGGVKDVDINLITAICNVQGTTYFGSAGENGNVLTLGGNGYTIYMKCGNVENVNADSVAPVIFMRTGVSGSLHFNGNINKIYSAASTWFHAGIQHQGGKLWVEGSIYVTNGACYVSSNFGATHLMRHIGGEFVSTNNSAIALQGTGPSGDQLSYVFDGHYESTNTNLAAAVMIGISLWEGQVFFGFSERFSIVQNTAGKDAINFNDAYGGANLTFGNGFIWVEDQATDNVIDGSGTPQFDFQGMVTSNCGNTYGTLIPAANFVSNASLKKAPLPTDVTTRYTVVQW